MKDKFHICNLEQCCNCGCCKEVCSQNAITLIKNNIGEVIPEINYELCVHCGRCQKKCILNNKKIDFKQPQSVYACYALNSEIHSKSASGGVASVLYKHYLDNFGVVYGAVEQYNHDIIIKEISDISMAQGSKYVKSICNECFSQIKAQLDCDKKVLYIGLPCQVAALLSFLGGTHKSLVTVDLICHGAPPLDYYKEYVDTFQNKYNFDQVIFRDNGDFVFELKDKEHIVYKRPSYRDLYMHAFLSALTYCSSCYSCKFAQLNRVSDITIGDFWGIEETGTWNGKTSKVSAVLINTNRGQELIDNCSYELYMEKKYITDVVKYNEQLKTPSGYHPDRSKFLQNYLKGGFIYGVKSTTIKHLCEKNAIKDVLNNIFHYFNHN